MAKSSFLYRFRLRDPLTGRERITRYHLTEEDALARYGPGAEKLESTRMEIRDYGRTSDFRNRKR